MATDAVASVTAERDSLQGIDEKLKVLGTTAKAITIVDDLNVKTKTMPPANVGGATDGATPEVAASAILDDLLRFRDRYFESHSVTDAHRKKADVAAEIQNALTKLEKLNDPLTTIGQQALYLTLRGRINNANQVSALGLRIGRC